MKKNVASQVVGAQMVSASDGSAFTGAVTCYVTGNGGTQAVGSVGSGACTHEGNGFHTYTPAQAETNYDHVAFTFIGTGAVPVTVQIYTTFPQTGDNYTRLGAPVGASLSADIAAVQADTDNLQTRIPAALVGGRMDASVGAMANDVLTAASIANGAIDRATLAADTGWQSIRSGTAQAGAAGTITLDASASPTTDFYAGLIVSLTGGAGAGQARVITAYNGTTKVATIAPNWATAPDNSSTFAILPFAHPTGVQGNLTGSVGSVAAGGITAASIATGAVDADALAADAVAEIANAVWDTDATAHQTQGSFGQAIGDPGADTNTIYKAVVTDATGATIGVDTTDILADTADMQPKLGTITDLGSGATLGANLVDIESQTDDIGSAGAGLTAIPWNAAWDAEVQSEVEDGLVAHRLDELLNADSDIDGLTPPTVGSVFHEVLSKTAGSFTYDQTTDSLEAIRDKAADIETDTAEIGVAGAGLTNITLPDQTMNITGNITGNLSGSVGSVTGAVGSVTGNVGGNVVGSIGSLAAQAKADVNAEVLDVLNVDTFAEPGQEAPAATNTLVKKIGYLFKFLRNKVTQDATTLSVYADDAVTVDHKATVSDDGTTYTRGEIGTGP